MASKLALVNGIPRMTVEAGTPTTIYDESVTLVAGVVTGTPVTLPLSKTFTGDELEIYLNDIRLEDVVDYTWVGSAPRTQVSFTFDLVIGDEIRYRIDRAP